MKIKIIKLTIFFFFFTSVSHSQNLELTDSGFNLPSLIYQNSRNNNINSDVDGIVSKIIKNKDDKYLVFIKTKTSYFYKNNLSVENYDLIYGNIEKVYIKENDKINYGTAIGLCEPECFVTSSFEKLSPFPIRLSQRKAIKFDNYYFFLLIGLINIILTFYHLDLYPHYKTFSMITSIGGKMRMMILVISPYSIQIPLIEFDFRLIYRNILKKF
ncbi:hypothetical protein [Leptospira levettii]|uniref:Uncharacterized protein n=1 Tax=Leptospira levettii TaxID=2023178 RepID=A0ABY2MNR5_9LEPT|nr:hypothetical protein [Leptospira levettii]TGL70952.1 hypothetical protein EHQ60_09575 [Leptospira levettii]